MITFLRVVHLKQDKEMEVFTAERCEDLEELDERREEAQERSRKYR